MTTPLGELTIGPREAGAVTVARTTRETDITVTLGLDGSGHTAIDTGIGFYDHLLGSFAHHGLFDLAIRPTATSRSTSTTPWRTSRSSSGPRSPRHSAIVPASRRFGDSAVPMDESLATAVIDVGGRPYAVIDLPFRASGSAACRCSSSNTPSSRSPGPRAPRSTCPGTGRNDHHLAEAAFKALGRALRVACEPDPRRDGRRVHQGRLG